MAYRLVQAFYWLCLGTWFGAIVMLIVAAPIVFATARGLEPTLHQPPYDQFPAQAADVLAGGTVGGMLVGLGVIQTVCAAGVLVCLGLQCMVWPARIAGGVRSPLNLLRIGLLLGPMLLLAVDRLVITPQLGQYQQASYTTGLAETERAEARKQFDHLHNLDVRVVSTAVVMLLLAFFASSLVLSGDAREMKEHTVHG